MSDVTTSHKEEVLDSVRREHEALAHTLARLNAAQMTTPGLYADENPDWTVKDSLAHITWWEQSVFGWLGHEFAVPRSPIPEGANGDDEINRYIFEGNRERSLDDVLNSFNHSYNELVSALQAASEEQLNQPRKSAPDGPPLWEIIPGNTYEHYQIHNQSILDWLDGAKTH